MASPIHCDVHGQAHLADVLVSQLASGDTMAACSEGYLELCRAFVAQAEAQAAAAEADATAADAADRLEAAGPLSSGESSDAADQPPGPPTSAVDGSEATEGTETPAQGEAAPGGPSLAPLEEPTALVTES